MIALYRIRCRSCERCWLVTRDAYQQTCDCPFCGEPQGWFEAAV